MKILLLNQTFYPDVVATGQYLSEVAEGLAKRGHRVTVVTGRRAYDDPNKLFPAREMWNGVKIFRVYSTQFGKKSKWRRTVDFSSFIFSSCFRVLFLPRHDMVVALTTPPLISFMAAWRAKLWREKFCYWVMDFNPDEAIAAGWIRADSIAARLLERMSHFSLRRANRIIALDRFMRDRIIAKGISPEKIVIIPPWSFDGEVYFDVHGREKFRAKHGLTDKFVVMYSGNHSPVHPLDTLLAAAEQFKENPSIMFCFVGGGSKFPFVRRWAEEGQHANVLCLPYQPLSELATSLSAADAHVVIMGNEFVGLVHPCKIYNILAVRAPVVYIGPRLSHVTEILDYLGSGHPSVCVQHGESQGLATQIQALYQKMKEGARPTSSEKRMAFSKGTLLENLISMLEESQGS